MPGEGIVFHNKDSLYTREINYVTFDIIYPFLRAKICERDRIRINVRMYTSYTTNYIRQCARKQAIEARYTQKNRLLRRLR